MSYRADVYALAARHDALAAEVAAKTKELDAARQMLDDMKQRARLPVLPNIRVATPCTADWNAMTGDERVRACAQCNKNVYNISELTREEAEALIVEKEGKLCVRYYQRKDGTILLKDCAVGVAQKRKRRVIAAGAALLLGGGAVAAFKLTRPDEGKAQDIEMWQGQAALTSITETATVRENPPPHALPEVQPEVQPEYEVKMGDISAPQDHVEVTLGEVE